MPEQHRHVEDAHLHLAADEVVHRRRRALVGHVHEIDLRLGLEQLAREVRDAAAAGRAEVHLAGILLRILDQLGDAATGSDGCTARTSGTRTTSVISATSFLTS